MTIELAFADGDARQAWNEAPPAVADKIRSLGELGAIAAGLRRKLRTMSRQKVRGAPRPRAGMGPSGTVVLRAAIRALPPSSAAAAGPPARRARRSRS